MKKTKIALIIGLMVAMVSVGFAQGPGYGKRGKGYGYGPRMERMDYDGPGGPGRFLDRIPDLTDAQKDKIEDLMVAHIKDVKPLRNEVREKRVKLQNLETDDNPSLSKINDLIDDIGALKITIQKKRAAHRQEVRKVLTEKQRLFFDRHGKKGQRGNGPGKGRGPCGR
jgi:Spy/CpxP family protein refolding chaperone